MRSSAWGVIGLAVVLGGCASGQQAVPQDDPGVVHIHALAIDPVDPTSLYVGTHTGLLHVEGDGTVERLGRHYHDLMGFTVVGPHDFIASGHPDLRTPQLKAPGQPPLLGLVQSTDGGADWEPLSLLGEADFHSLEAKHGLVYGYDSTGGRFMVSPDRKTWEARSALPLLDFAVSPESPGLIVGSGASGLVRSIDGGRTWQPAADVPYVILDWADAGLYGVAADGTIAVSADDGTTWEPRGAIGVAPEALLASDDLLVAAAADRGIVESRDGGRTWTVRLATGERAGAVSR